MTLAAFPPQKSVGFVEVSRSYVYVKITLLLSLLVTVGCGALASWAAQHTTVSLDKISFEPAELHKGY